MKIRFSLLLTLILLVVGCGSTGSDGWTPPTPPSGGGWYKYYELSFNWPFYGIGFANSNNGWAVGIHLDYHRGVYNKGIIYHCRDSINWVAQADSGDSEILFTKVKAFDDNNVWAIGYHEPSSGGGAGGTPAGSIWFFNGSSWAEQYNTGEGSAVYLRDLTVVNANHAWAVGYDQTNGRGVVYFYNGVSWGNQFTSSYSDTLWGIASQDAEHVWAVTRNCIYFYNGIDWTEQLRISDENSITFYGADMVSNDLGWAVGYDQNRNIGVIYRYDGTSWSEQFNTGDKAIILVDISMVDANHGWAIGPTNTTDLPSETNPVTIYYYDGSNWSDQYHAAPTFNAGPWPKIASIYAIDANNCWAAMPGGSNQGLIYRYKAE